jgi:hypothetical protein
MKIKTEFSNRGKKNFNNGGSVDDSIYEFRRALGEEDPELADAFDAIPIDLEPKEPPPESKKTSFVDLVALWKSGLKPEKPTVVKVSETRCLFYAGR